MSATLSPSGRQTVAEIQAGRRARLGGRMKAALDEIARYVGEHPQGKIILAWRADGEVTMDRTESWHPPRGA